MHLKSITMKGFKSFPDRTRLVFSPGVSVIVGPNGCGKSNITDAVLWALGEQSPLAVRGQTMQDMIFAGGKGQSRRRFAEVEVVIENESRPAESFAGGARPEGGRGGEAPMSGSAGSPAGAPFSELAIKRRLDRAGEGEYRLNGARCRLADVLEVLSDANLGGEMHSVISQGNVEEVVHSKPRDRRLLVEEAAGLGKHRKRRRRAQLKLERTRDNLDRALDVEREARSHLRPLKRQAQAAETHARLERETLELRASLVADELRVHESDLARTGREAAKAREGRDEIEGRLAEINRRRTEIEEQFAQRDRERTILWGRMTALRGLHERLSVRAESLSGRSSELEVALERRRDALGDLVPELGVEDGDAEGDPMSIELGRIEQALGGATRALLRARAGQGDISEELARVREGSERAARASARAERLLGKSRQDSLERRVAAEAQLLPRLRAAARAVAAGREAIGERIDALERRMLEDEDAGDVTEALRECSQREYAIQADLRSAAEAVTEAEVKLAHLEERRDEVLAELQRIGARLGVELGPAAEALGEDDRADVERKLERLARRREQLGPVNPLAEREYEEARDRVSELEHQREDLETALAELEKVIRETDRKIKADFEETFEATARNFEELVEHLFPGGRGRLRLVDIPKPRAVLGGADPPEPDAGASEEGDRSYESERAGAADSDGNDEGVEIEVTPAGKATRRLSLLSGGEKSLVALAFLFAVFLARPSPFYILDEVEAALDDANIDRFLQLVRRFAKRAQFVIVTHQKRTMDAADVLYGVSMGEGGITKVISRRLPRDEAEPEPAEAAEAA
jgi:chromosome segregation ATPase